MGSSSSKLKKKKNGKIQQVDLPPYPLAPTHGVMCCCFYQNTAGEKYILCCMSHVGIYKYDTQIKEWSKFADYPDEMSKADMRLEMNCTMDYNTRKLYIFPDWNWVYSVLDIETKQWKHYDGASFYNIAKNPRAICVESKLHIIGGQTEFYHFVDDLSISPISPHAFKPALMKSNESKTKVMLKLLKSVFHDETLHKYQLFYIDALKQKQLMIFHEGYKMIWYCSLNDLIWQKHDLKLPYKDWRFFAMVVYDCIIVMIYYNRNEIWCLDLVENRWFKSNKNADKMGVACFGWYVGYTVRNDNVVHMIGVQKPLHISMKLIDIIPVELYRNINQKYMVLITGFIKEAFNNKSLHVADDIIELTAKFCFKWIQ